MDLGVRQDEYLLTQYRIAVRHAVSCPVCSAPVDVYCMKLSVNGLPIPAEKVSYVHDDRSVEFEKFRNRQLMTGIPLPTIPVPEPKVEYPEGYEPHSDIMAHCEQIRLDGWSFSPYCQQCVTEFLRLARYRNMNLEAK